MVRRAGRRHAKTVADLGRAKTKTHAPAIKVICTPDYVKKLDRVADKYKIARTLVIREAIIYGLVPLEEVLKQMKKEGKL